MICRLAGTDRSRTVELVRRMAVCRPNGRRVQKLVSLIECKWCKIATDSHHFADMSKNVKETCSLTYLSIIFRNTRNPCHLHRRFKARWSLVKLCTPNSTGKSDWHAEHALSCLGSHRIMHYKYAGTSSLPQRWRGGTCNLQYMFGRGWLWLEFRVFTKHG